MCRIGVCEITLKFDRKGRYDDPPNDTAEGPNLLRFIEPTAVGHEHVLRWFLQAMRVLYCDRTWVNVVGGPVFVADLLPPSASDYSTDVEGPLKDLEVS